LCGEDLAHAVGRGRIGDRGAEQRHEGLVAVPPVDHVADDAPAELSGRDLGEIG
jgi:hypothetical protein